MYSIDLDLRSCGSTTRLFVIVANDLFDYYNRPSETVRDSRTPWSPHGNASGFQSKGSMTLNLRFRIKCVITITASFVLSESAEEEEPLSSTC